MTSEGRPSGTASRAHWVRHADELAERVAALEAELSRLERVDARLVDINSKAAVEAYGATLRAEKAEALAAILDSVPVARDEEEPVDEFEPADPCPYHDRDRDDDAGPEDDLAVAARRHLDDELQRLLLVSQRENELLRGKVWRLEVQVADLIEEREDVTPP